MATESSKSLRHTASNGNEYTLTFNVDSVQIERYSSGSLAGGSDTECGHTISGLDNLKKLLGKLDVPSLEILFVNAAQYNDQEWSELHTIIQDNQTSYYLLD